MAWVTSLLVNHQGKVEASWLKPAVTVAEFLSPFVRRAESYVQPHVRKEFEDAIAADRELLEKTMQPGDVLRPWYDGPYQLGQVGLAVLRGERVVKAWRTAILN